MYDITIPQQRWTQQIMKQPMKWHSDQANSLKRQLLLQFFRTITWGSADNNWRREISVQDVISGLFILIVVFSYYFVISKSLISNPPEAAVRPLGNWYREFSTWESTIWNRCSISIIQCKIYFTHGFVFLLVVCVILI